MFYIVSMKKNDKSAFVPQGGVDAKDLDSKVEINLKSIKKMLSYDLGAAILCLQAIQSDPDMLDSVAQFMYGRFMNNKVRQEELFVDETKPKV